MKLRLVLGDQLSEDISSLSDVDKQSDIILMCEVRTEATYVKHHKKKIAFLFSAMRHFAADLVEQGFLVTYIKYDDPLNTGSFFGEVERELKKSKICEVILTEPSEYRLMREVKTWSDQLHIPVTIKRDSRFLCSTHEFETWANGRKQLRMEYFYREMRRKYSILMEDDKPVGGQWNFDSDNRKPPKKGLEIPPVCKSEPDQISKDVLALVEQNFPDHFGDLLPFHFAVTRKQALLVFSNFIQTRLARFGDYQDAMLQDEPWMFHSHIGFYLNCGLLNPLECIRQAEEAYENGAVPLNAVEGFIRQILGWREYIRGIYWLKMPDYKSANFLEADRKSVV